MIRKVSILPILAASCLTMATACSDNTSGQAVPRPPAYPRIEIPDTAYTSVDAAGLRLLCNNFAEVSTSPSRDGLWIDVRYPTLASPCLYLSLNECGSSRIDEVLDNRRERISLNLGGLPYELTEFATPSGWQCAVAVARGSLTTPVQLLAHDTDRVLSGTLMLSLPDSVHTDPMMIAPVVDAVERDVIVMLKGLGND